MLHHEELRPDGIKYITDYVNTGLARIDRPFQLYIVDNGSPQNNRNLFRDGLDYYYIEDQFISGITGAWNFGIEQAISDGCDIICVTNDDITFNPTINIFIDYIRNDKHNGHRFYGPMTNGVMPPSKQKSPTPINDIIIHGGKHGNDVINGFFFAFTKEFYDTYKHKNGQMFALKHENDGGDGKWGGQEGEFLRWCKEGAQSVIIGTSWIYHHKIRGYRNTRKIDIERNS